MNVKTTLVLLAALIGIGVYFLVFEKGRQSAIDPSGPEGLENPMFTVEEMQPIGVQTITIQWSDGQKVAMVSQENRWSQSAPVTFPLNPYRVAGLLNDAALLRYVDKFKPGDAGKPTLADTGLDKPRAIIRFTGEYSDTQIQDDGESRTTTNSFDQTLRIGGGLTGSRGYLQINDDPHVYVVNNNLHAILMRERIADWRMKTFETPSEPQAQRIVLSADDQTMEIWKNEGEWRFGPPINDRVAPKGAAALLGLLRSAQIAAFVTDEPKSMAAYGLDKPVVTVVVQTTTIQPKVRTLRIGSPADPTGFSHYASWTLGEGESPVIFTVTRDVRGRFTAPKVADLRDPRVTPMKASSVVQITLSLPDRKPVQIQKTIGAGWEFYILESGPPMPFRPDPQALDHWLDAITTATAKYYQPHASRPDVPLATIELTSNVPKGLEKLYIYPAPDGAVPKGETTEFRMVLRNNETTGYLVPASQLAVLLEPVVKLRDRQVLDVMPQTIEQITLKRSDDVSYVFRQSAPKVDPDARLQWGMVGAEVFERDMLDQLLRLLPTLRVETWLVDDVELGKNTVEVTIETKAGSPKVLTIDLDSGKGRLAGTDGAFKVTEQVRLLLDAEYRPRTVLDLAPGDVVQITITREKNRPVTFERDELGRYHMLDDGKPLTTIRLNTENLARLFDQLTPLRAWRLLPTPDPRPGDPSTTIDLTARTGKKYTLAIGFKDNPALAHIGDTWFTLAPQTLGILTAEPMKAEAEK